MARGGYFASFLFSETPWEDSSATVPGIRVPS